VDPLSDVLQLLAVRSVLPSRFEAGGDWAVSFPAFRHVKFGAVYRGEAWIVAAGVEPELLRAGDCYVLTGEEPYVIASDPDLEPTDGVPAFRSSPDGIARVGTRAGAAGGAGGAAAAAGGGTGIDVPNGSAGPADVVVTAGRFTFDEERARLLLDVLPRLLVVRASADGNDALHHALALFGHETEAPRMGSALATERVAQIVLVQALRAAAEGDGAVTGWLRGLRDERVGAALRLMHADLARRWTVAELAEAALLSRSAFAARFTALVGTSPLDHLLRVRMHAAGHDLQDPDVTVSAVADRWGYTSDSAFSNAFKRVMGASPRAWRTAVAERGTVDRLPGGADPGDEVPPSHRRRAPVPAA
jgi:AraC-like DNA-binding protein